jgi:hypothetical protein
MCVKLVIYKDNTEILYGQQNIKFHITTDCVFTYQHLYKTA